MKTLKREISENPASISINTYLALIAAALVFSAAHVPALAGPGSQEMYESIFSATSGDGRIFTQDAGERLSNGYVDPYVLRALRGDWLMLVSTTPSSNRLPQKIYMASSADGMGWQVNTNVLIEVPGGNALDATAVALSDGSYRVYYAATPTPDPFRDFYLASGILRTNAQGFWSFTPDGVSLGINGVSPEAFALSNNAVRLYVTATGGMKVYRAEDGLTFTEEEASLPPGSDPSIITLPSHQLRMYYVEMNAEGNKEIFSALSSDGLNWNAEGTTGINCGTSAGGVPDSFVDPDGYTRLFWVGSPTSQPLPSVASPAPVFSAHVNGLLVGKVQTNSSSAAVNFAGLSDSAWSSYELLGATAHAPESKSGVMISVVVMDNSTKVPYLAVANENNTLLGHEALFGMTDTSTWAAYAVDAAGDLNGDGFVEYVIRNRASGSTLLAYSSGSTNQLQGTGPVLGLDPAGLAGYRIEGAGDADSDGFADLMVRDLASGIMYLVHNNAAQGYDSVLPLFGLSADTWSLYRLESTGDFNMDGLLDYVVQDAAKTFTYKLFGTGSNSYSSIENIP